MVLFLRCMRRDITDLEKRANKMDSLHRLILGLMFSTVILHGWAKYVVKPYFESETRAVEEMPQIDIRDFYHKLAYHELRDDEWHTLYNRLSLDTQVNLKIIEKEFGGLREKVAGLELLSELQDYQMDLMKLLFGMSLQYEINKDKINPEIQKETIKMTEL